MPKFIHSILLFIACVSGAYGNIDFNSQIKSLLSNRCIACHGPDEEHREAGLRIDTFEGATRDLDGYSAIVPGNPEDSEILFRVTLPKGDEERMPPKGKGEPLSKEEVALLTEWIKQGAEYDKHWSYKQTVRPEVPANVHPVDHFIRKRLQEEGIKPSTKAGRRTIARRVSLDLIGLPPKLDEVNAFVTDKAPNAYDKFVDRLLARPEFGEHWARMWLDLARYADSAGYADDPPRTIWAYRDYVIRAFNKNLPFDQFTIEQLAGDLLPEPTEDQLVATAFHRNTQTNNEGGTNDEEFRNVAVVDRVNTTFATWMGTTMACANCHTHKYDPITHEEYFKVFDILNQTEDSDKRDERPFLQVKDASSEQRRAPLRKQIEELKAKIKEKKPVVAKNALPVRKGPLKARYVRIVNPDKQSYLHLAEVEVYQGGKNLARAGKATQISTGYNGPAKLAIDGNTNGDYFVSKSVTHTAKADGPWLEIDLGSEQAIDRILVFNRTDGAAGSRLKQFWAVTYDSKRKPVWAHLSKKTPNPKWEGKLPKTHEALSKGDKDFLASYLKIDQPSPGDELTKKLKDLEKKLAGIKGPTVPIFRELAEAKRRKTHIHLRGSYLNRGDQVEAGFPKSLFRAPEGVGKPTRLDLAKWLVDEKNPLTSRVSVNRFWEKIFGIGLVATSEEFGSQGELPSHPELLDWLATEFVRTGWDVKAFIKLLVTSETYLQNSHVTDEMAARDPVNRFLARGPRIRLSAEMVRDQALSVSGLLSSKMYGPPVRPPQPNMGLRAAFGGGIDWKTSAGEDRYRRGLYTTWRRSNPYPSMATFDAPNREVCTVRRDRTNTPLQALVTMNDPVYVEAAQSLARKMISSGETTPDRLKSGFETCLSRPPTKQELDRLVKLFEQVRIRYAEDAELAKKMATNPIGPVPKDADLTDLAALTVAGNVMLNLDEMLMKR
ncbi:MAG: DUF1553 domain-containing protein [Opitutae bacterium]|nr:DUF1553 domain-containing protein [Opitutae bacterium]